MVRSNNSREEGGAKESTASEYTKRVSLAMNYISENLHRDLTLDEIARSAFFSTFHFHRIFKAVVGETPGEFARRLRLEAAANRLLSPKNESVTVIALDMGFTSSQNFARSFRKHFGMTPSMFRKSKKGHKISNGGNEITSLPGYLSKTAEEYLYRTGDGISAEIRILSDMHVACVRKMGRYGKETFRMALSELRRWAFPAGYMDSGNILAISLDNPEITPTHKCRLDVCVRVPEGTETEGKTDLRVIPGGRFLICHFEIDVEMIPLAWEDAFVYLVRNGLECDDRPPFEMVSIDSSNNSGSRSLSIYIPLR